MLTRFTSNSANLCSTSLATTPYCADASWELWENQSGSPPYFCCLEGQLGLQTGECVSGKQVAAPSLIATSVRALPVRSSIPTNKITIQLGIVTAGAVFQTGTETKPINTATTTAETTESTITTAPTATTKTINGGSVESSIVSKVSSVLHGGAGQRGIATYAAEAVVGAVIAAGVFL